MSYARLTPLGETPCLEPLMATTLVLNVAFWALVHPIAGLAAGYLWTSGCAYLWCQKDKDCQDAVQDYVRGLALTSMSDATKDQGQDIVNIIQAKYDAAVAAAATAEPPSVPPFQPPPVATQPVPPIQQHEPPSSWWYVPMFSGGPSPALTVVGAALFGVAVWLAYDDKKYHDRRF